MGSIFNFLVTCISGLIAIVMMAILWLNIVVNLWNGDVLSTMWFPLNKLLAILLVSITTLLISMTISRISGDPY